MYKQNPIRVIFPGCISNYVNIGGTNLQKTRVNMTSCFAFYSIEEICMM